jgi:hypothetical protein
MTMQVAPERNNACFYRAVTENQSGCDVPQVAVQMWSTKEIAVGEEIFVGYGVPYWFSQKKNKKKS